VFCEGLLLPMLEFTQPPSITSHRNNSTIICPGPVTCGYVFRDDPLPKAYLTSSFDDSMTPQVPRMRVSYRRSVLRFQLCDCHILPTRLRRGMPVEVLHGYRFSEYASVTYRTGKGNQYESWLFVPSSPGSFSCAR